jgi:hypothetical protein
MCRAMRGFLNLEVPQCATIPAFEDGRSVVSARSGPTSIEYLVSQVRGEVKWVLIRQLGTGAWLLKGDK